MVRSRLLERSAMLLLAMLSACAAAPPVVIDPEKELAAAESQLAAGEAQACRDRLLAQTAQLFPRRLRDRYDLLLANAHFALGETWQAFEITEKFPDRHPHSELRATIVELDWQLARAMATSGRGFLFFWSDRHAARTVLEHVITRHPDSPRLADALRLLGDIAYEDGDYTLAQERFRDLMRKRPDSEWVVYARFRFAMSIVAGLQGPDYDLDQMQHASRELQAFLDGKPENPEFVTTASAALRKLLEWQATRQLQIADYYRTIGNGSGERRHLELAGAAQYFGTEANQRASERLAALPATAAAVKQ
jgi:outer membrane protein assembly factor BamD (BamD/ComL family)